MTPRTEQRQLFAIKAHDRRGRRPEQFGGVCGHKPGERRDVCAGLARSRNRAQRPFVSGVGPNLGAPRLAFGLLASVLGTRGITL